MDYTINCHGRLLDFSSPLVMGIVNITDNSFYSASGMLDEESLVARIGEMVEEGVDILDLGACSTRPGSLPPDPAIELARLARGVDIARRVAPEIPISIDTYRAYVAESLLQAGLADIVNDISGGELDEGMYGVVAKHQAPYILMHMQGTPADMQQQPEYEDVVREVLHYFAERVARLHALGVSDIILDPGFGFGKTVEHNYTLLRNLDAFAELGKPLLVGMSRKSMVNRVLGTSPEEALLGTQVVDTLALSRGASILRVHDVRAAVQAVKIWEVYSEQPEW